MTSVRKKKKSNSDPKASEQMRKWLSTPKVKKSASHPVTFQTFSSVVKNLPDIAFQIQCTELGADSKSLDECADWYYNAFYTDPSVRSKYEFQLKSCPLAVKQKLLQLPSDVPQPTNHNVQTEDGVVVKVSRCGRFLFPVAFSTFEKYIDKKSVLENLLNKQNVSAAERATMLANKETCRKLLKKYYNAFYMFPQRRCLNKYNFKGAPSALLEQLLKVASPLDEEAAKTLENNQSKAKNSKEPTRSTSQCSILSTPSTCSIQSVVSFAVFEKYVTNIYDIVFRLKLNEPEFAYKGYEDCAYAYYLAFYLTPEIRDRYPYQLGACTTAMREFILALPNEEDRRKLRQIQKQVQCISSSSSSQHQVETQVFDFNGNKSTPQVEETQDHNHSIPSEQEEQLSPEIEVNVGPGDAELPPVPVAPSVSFDQFKRSVKNLDEIVQQMLSCEEFKHKSADECALEYFRQFYANPQIRKRYEFKLKSCPAKMREKLLGLPEKVTVATDSERNLVTIRGITYEYPVTFETFLRYLNCDELKTQLTEAYEKQNVKVRDNFNDEKLMRRFYHSFYLEKQVRNKFKYNFNGAPEELRDKLMQLAVPLGTKEQQESSQEPTTSQQEQEKHIPEPVECAAEIKEISISSCVLDVVEDLGIAGRYMFPVSLETFERCINFDDLIRPLLKRVIKDEAELEAMATDAKHPQCQRIFKRYYHSFYVRPNTRKLYPYRFENVNEELMQKLLSFALPLDKIAKQQMDEAAAGMQQEANQKEACIEPTTSLESAQEQLEHMVQNEMECDNDSDVLSISACVFDVVEDLGKAGRFLFPVSFETFERCINYNEIIKPLLMRVTEDEAQLDAISTDARHPQCQKIFKRFYHSFYVRPMTRTLYPYRFGNVNEELMQKLLSLAVPLDETAKQQMDEVTTEMLQNKTKEQDEISKQQMDEAAAEISQNTSKDKDEELFKTFPVTFKLFKNNIRNLNEIVQQMLTCDEYKDKTEDECVLAYYKAFYTQPQIREKYKFEFKPCPGKLRIKLLMLPDPPPAAVIPETQIENEPEPPCEEPAPVTDIPASNKVLIQSETILITLQGILYEFPVSFQTFKRYINYDTVRIELANSYSSTKQEMEDILKSEEQTMLVLQNFYYTFYLNEQARYLCHYNFNAAPEDLQQKLHQFAIPLLNNVLTVMEEKQVEDIEMVGNEEKQVEDIEMAVNEEKQVEDIEMAVNEEKEMCAKDSLPEQTLTVAEPTSIESEKVAQTQPNKDIKYPISYNIFSKILNLDEVVKQMQQESQYAQMNDDECKLAYFDAFYRTPEIRTKYSCTLKPCPAQLKAQLLQIPQDVEENTATAEQELSQQNLAELYAARKAELASMEKLNVVRYMPHNLSSYITRKIKCPKICALLEQNFIGNKEQRQKSTEAVQQKKVPAAAAEIISYPVKATNVVSTEASTNAATASTAKIVEPSATTVAAVSIPATTSAASTITMVASKAVCLKPSILKPVDKEATTEKPIIAAAKTTATTFAATNSVPTTTPAETTVESAATEANIETKTATAAVTVAATAASATTEATSGATTGATKVARKASPVPTSSITSTDTSTATTTTVTTTAAKAAAAATKVANVAKKPSTEPTSLISSVATTAATTNAAKTTTKTTEATSGATKAASVAEKASTEPTTSATTTAAIKTAAKPTGGTATITEPATLVATAASKAASGATKVQCVAKKTSTEPTTSATTTAATTDAPATTAATKTAATTTAPASTVATAASEASSEATKAASVAKKPSTKPATATAGITTRAKPTNACVANKPTSTTTTTTATAATSTIVTATISTRTRTTAATTTAETTNKPSSTTTAANKTAVGKRDENTTTAKTTAQATAAVATSVDKAPTTATVLTTANTATTSNQATGTKETSEPNLHEKLLALLQQEKIISRSVSPATVTANFLNDSSKEHNIKYLMYTSHGLKNTIWRILSSLSFNEFRMYTSIYEGESFYENTSILMQCFFHVLDRGNWPLSLYVKLQMLPQLLHSKGIQLKSFDLSQFSPKMLHWQELIPFSNFDEIVKKAFVARTGKEIDDVEQLYNEIVEHYKLCWEHDQWIYQVPQITDEALIQSLNSMNNAEVEELPPSATQRVWEVPRCMIEDCMESSGEVITESMPDADLECPPTQLNSSLCSSSFVDINAVCPFSQAAETQNDPLNQTLQTVHIKQEPIKFLNMMRFSPSSQSGEFNCEVISTEDQIINIDNSDDQLIPDELTCFAIPNSADVTTTSLSPPVAILTQEEGDEIHELISELLCLADETVDDWDSPLATAALEQPTATVSPPSEPTALEQPSPATSPPVIEIAQPEKTYARKHKAAAATTTTSAVPKKKARLMADNVPQLRHEFRPLPLVAMVRIEPQGLEALVRRESLSPQLPQQQDLPPSTSNPSSQDQPARTISQELATDNTLLASSQLQHLLDAPFVSQRKVNENQTENVVSETENSNKQTLTTTRTQPILNKPKSIVFRSLERFMYFGALTTAHISKYHINSLAVGNPYQQALISVNGQLCNVYGPLLESLFSYCTPSLIADLQYLLSDLGEFSYNCRSPLKKDSTEDLRSRVLTVFMRAAHPFAQFRVTYENETREWAACSVINQSEGQDIKRKPKCDVSSVIRPEILERMRQVKCSLL